MIFLSAGLCVTGVMKNIIYSTQKPDMLNCQSLQNDTESPSDNPVQTFSESAAFFMAKVSFVIMDSCPAPAWLPLLFITAGLPAGFSTA